MATATQPRTIPPRPTAADIMTPSPRTCSVFSTVTEAALIFRDEDCGIVPVIDDGKPVGILTDRDVALATTQFPDLPSRTIAEVMTQGVVTVLAEAPLDELRETYADAKVHRLLVVDAAGQLVGIITWADLVSHLSSCEVGEVVADVLDRPSAGPETRTDSRDALPRAEGKWAWARPKALWTLLRGAAHEYMEDKVPRLGAALAYYSVLSLAPLVLITIAIAGMVFGREAAQGQLVGQIRGLVGPEGSKAIQAMIANAAQPRSGAMATLIGVATLLFGASGVFGELQDAMNTIWEVQPKPGRGVLGFLKDRFLSFAMVLGTGFLLLVSLILSAALAAFFTFAGHLAPGLGFALEATNTLVSFAVVATLFTLIFKVLPDVKIAWRDVWVGAVLTALLFMLGKGLIGLYLGRSGVASAYGAAGSLVALLIWVYYSAQILYFGAEFTKVYANWYGARIVPDSNAEPLTAEARAHQGIPKSAPSHASGR